MKTATKKTTAKNVIHFPTNRKAMPPKEQSEESTRVSFTLASDIYGFAVGDKIICETVFDVNNFSRSALVVATNSDGRNLMTATAAKITNADIYGVVVAFERQVKH